MSFENEHIDDLIGKVICGEASEIEMAELNKWLDLSDDNRRYFGHLTTIFEGAANNREELTFDTDSAWKKIRAGMSVETKVIEIGGRGSKMNWRIAATVALLLGMAFSAFLFFKDKPTEFAMISGNEIIHDSLPDGSVVTLNKGSKLTYSNEDNHRTVHLEGEAFFEVVHDEHNPFIVETNGLFVKDVGTSFNVKSIMDSAFVEVVVNEGEVVFYSAKNPGIHLQAGNRGTYNLKNGVFERLETIQDNSTSYVNKDFHFYNATLRKVLKKINEVYDIKLELDSEELAECRITVNFNNEEIHAIAATIAMTFNWTIQETDSAIRLSGKGCE